MRNYLKLTLILFLAFSFWSFNSEHKFYISLTQVEYAAKHKAVQITMNVFVDDFESALEHSNEGVSFRLNMPEEIENLDTYIETYLLKRFAVTLNDELTTYNYLGHKYEGDLIYFYIEIENVENVSSISVKNQMLFDTIPEQQNLIKLKINGKFKSLMLTKDNNKGLLNF